MVLRLQPVLGGLPDRRAPHVSSWPASCSDAYRACPHFATSVPPGPCPPALLCRIRTLPGHKQRVGCMSWNHHTLATGSRDRSILLRDVRAAEPYVQKLNGHRSEVCGLRWSPDDRELASGGNDNQLCVWHQHSVQPVLRFTEHQAAVKAIAWSPHQHGLLVSGGGTADRCIRFWNTTTGQPLQCIDTGSQVGVVLLFVLVWSVRCMLGALLEHVCSCSFSPRTHPHAAPPTLPARLPACPTLDLPAGVQPVVVQECQRAGQHPRLLPEPDYCVAVPRHAEAGHADGAHDAGALPGGVARRTDNSDRWVQEMGGCSGWVGGRQAGRQAGGWKTRGGQGRRQARLWCAYTPLAMADLLPAGHAICCLCRGGG